MKPANPVRTPEMFTLPEGVWHTDYKATPAELFDVIERMRRVGDVPAPAYEAENKAVMLAGRGHLYFYSKRKDA